MSRQPSLSFPKMMTVAVLVLIALLSVVAAPAHAQYMAFTEKPSNPINSTTAPVTVIFGGEYGQEYLCDYDGWTCWYEQYDYSVDPATFTFTVNGVDQTSGFILTATGDPYTACNGGGSWRCVDQITATGWPTFVAGQANTLTASGQCRWSPTPCSWTPSVSYQFTASLFAVSTAFTNSDNQDVGMCAASCFAVTSAVSTVPYFSLDAPRSITLLYNSDRVAVQPFVYADVTPASGGPTPLRYRLQVKVDSSWARFMNDTTILYFAGSSDPRRLAAQLDLSSKATGSYPLRISVTPEYSDRTGPAYVDSTQRVLVVNRRNSPIARGWAVAGVDRLYVQSGAGASIVDGGGSARFYRYTGCDATKCDYTSPVGDFSRLTYRISTQQYTRVYSDSSTEQFDNAGLQLWAASRTGDTTRFEYDASGRLSKVYDPFRTKPAGGRTYIQLQYNGTFGIASITEPGANGTPGAGRVTTFTVTDSLLRRVTDPDAGFTRFGYDSQKRLVRDTNRAGGVTTYTYHTSSGKLVRIDMPQVTIDTAGGPTRVGRPFVQFTPWQSVGVPYGPTSAGAPAAAIAPDTAQGVVVDAGGNATRFTVDRWGQPLRTTDALGRVTVVSRTGVLATGIRQPWYPSGVQDSLEFTNGRLTASRPAYGDPTFFEYDTVWGQLKKTWGPNRPTVDRTLGPRGRVTDEVANGVLLMHYSYDTRSRIDSTRDGGDHETSYTYDPIFGNLQSSTAPGNRVSARQFDGHGRDSVHSANGGPTVTTLYDSLNRAVQVYDGVNAAPTTYTYSDTSLTVRDARRSTQFPTGQAYHSNFDALMRPVQQVDPDQLNGAATSGYESRGLPASLTNRRGQRIEFTYDAVGRLRTRGGSANIAPATFTYSANGLTAVDSNAVSLDSTFAAPAGWTDSVVTRLTGAGGVQRRFRIFYHHTSTGIVDTIGMHTDVPGFVFARRAWGQDLGTFIHTVTVNGQATATYPNVELLDSLTTLPISLSSATLYTSIHAPSEVSYDTPSEAVHTALDRRYGYNADGRVTSYLRSTYSNCYGYRCQDFNVGRQFSYDDLGRITGEGEGTSALCGGLDLGYGYACATCPMWIPTEPTSCYGYNNDVTPTNAFTYDEVGNRTEAANAQYGAGNRVQTFGDFTFEHDADGNMTRKTQTSTGRVVRYAWTADGLLDSVVVTGDTIHYDYNAAGQLVRRIRNHAVERLFLWDGDQLLAELDGSFNRVAEYVYYPGIDRPHSIVTKSGTNTLTRYFAQDALGNVIGVAGSNSATAEEIDYAVWGSPTITGTLGDTNRLAWKGLPWEGGAVRLYYVRNRWYDPDIWT